MTIVLTLIGAGLILTALRDIFQQLFHPSGGGSLSRLLMRSVWGAVRRASAPWPAQLSLAGPVTLVVIILSWVALLAVGWALIIWPQMPQGFLYQTGLEPSEHDGFLTALYFSMTTLATLGFGDIVPTSGWLRILEPLQAFTGFAVLTASVSWILSIYPALTQRYALAHQVNLLRESEGEPGNILLETDVQTAEQTLYSFAQQLITVKGELVQFPITYYFYNNDDQSSLPRAMPYLAYLAERMSQEDLPLEVRFRAGMLRGAIRDFASVLGSNFLGLHSASTTGILEAYARDHFRRTPLKDEESFEQDQ